MMATSFVALVEVHLLTLKLLHLYKYFLDISMHHFFSICEQSTGAFIAVSRYASATPVPHSVLSRGIGWQVCSSLHHLATLNSPD